VAGQKILKLGQTFRRSENFRPKSGILHINLMQCIQRRRCRLGLERTSLSSEQLM
jgi:hypothetical protein